MLPAFRFAVDIPTSAVGQKPVYGGVLLTVNGIDRVLGFYVPKNPDDGRPWRTRNLPKYCANNQRERSKEAEEFFRKLLTPETAMNETNKYIQGLTEEDVAELPEELKKTLSLAHANQRQIEQYNVRQAIRPFMKHDMDIGSLEPQSRYLGPCVPPVN